MADLEHFDATQVPPNAGFSPVPAGDYVCIITRSERKPTQNGSGSYLELELEIVEGPEKGRKVFDRLVMWHTNQKTVEIARGTLSAICHAVNVLKPRDSFELHNIPLKVTVGQKKREDNGDLTNVVKGYAPKSATSAPQASSPPQQQAAPQTTRAPWQR